MRYKDIARGIILSRGINNPVEAGDGKRHNPSGRDFTPGQLEKVRAAFDTSADWLKKKWKLEDE